MSVPVLKRRLFHLHVQSINRACIFFKTIGTLIESALLIPSVKSRLPLFSEGDRLGRED